MNIDYELAVSKEKLELAKLKAREFFNNNKKYTDDDNFDWYAFFEQTINKIIRRESIHMGFGPGGSPEWYAETLEVVSEWIAAEYAHSKIVGRCYNPHDFIPDVE